MGQDIFQISLLKFEMMLWRFDNKALKKTFEDIYKFKKDNWRKWNPEYPDHFQKIDDLERKTTMIEREMQRRGFTPSIQDSEGRVDYIKWQHRQFYKKSVY
jgi:hypothetical protein